MLRPGLLVLASLSLLLLSGCSHTTSGGSSAATPGSSDAKETSSASAAGDEAPEAQELDAKTLMAIAQGHYLELRSCYETQLKERPELKGLVEVELTIDSNGHIREGRIINDNIGDPDLQFCIAQRILGWKFPPHRDESLTVQFPFEFEPVVVDGPIQD